ncbi:MAG: RHS repeat-associated core domain-containing protein [Gammaproteobacteria bacterium]|jgi:RHS repeat-associated protein
MRKKLIKYIFNKKFNKKFTKKIIRIKVVQLFMVFFAVFFCANVGFAEIITLGGDTANHASSRVNNLVNISSNNLGASETNKTKDSVSHNVDRAVNEDVKYLFNARYLGYNSAKEYAKHHINPDKLKPYPGTVNDNPYAVGSIASKLNINPNGSASYSIPIAVAPGTAGMSPELKIAYNSQQKDGLLGMGFSLAGLTAIIRAPQTKGQNGNIHGVDFTNNDRFTLNGQQLVAVNGDYGANGTEYRTYFDSEAKIKSFGQQGNGPAYFQVWTKGGQMAEYAKTPDSQQIAQGQDTVATWGLNKIIDTKGNYLQVKYYNDKNTGSFYPTEIDYTGNDAAKLTPYNKVLFIYEDRPDVQVKYLSGSKITMDKRLKEIQVYTEGNLTYDYKLIYDQSSSSGNSRLISVQECAGDKCLTPTKFTWNDGTRGFIHLGNYDNPGKLPGIGLAQSGVDFLDLTGNGLTDVYYQPKWGGASGAWINNGNSWQRSSSYAPPTIGESYLGEDLGIRFADLTGNGLPDIVQSFEGGKTAWINTGNGWKSVGNYIPPVQFNKWVVYPGESHDSNDKNDNNGVDLDLGVRFVDLNGNGRMDMVQGLDSNDAYWRKGRHAWINTGTGWQANDNYAPPTNIIYINEIDHDDWAEFHIWDRGERFVHLTNSGLPDFVSNSGAWINTGSGWKKADNYNLPVQVTIMGGGDNKDTVDNGVRFIDLTGNGLTDIISNNGAWINTGKGWLRSPRYDLPSDLPIKIVDSNCHLDQGIRFVDVSGNGLPDLLTGENGVWLNTGNGWKKDTTGEYSYLTSFSNKLGINLARFIDVQGTGFLGIISDKRDGTEINILKGPDLLIGIKNGVGKKIEISYKPLTNSNIYTKEHNALYPNADFQGAMYVVSQTSEDTDDTDPTKSKIHGAQNNKETRVKLQAEDQHVTKYHYTGAKLNHNGWGFLGFHQVKTQDATTGIYTIDTYSQDADNHLLGNLLSKQTYSKEGTLLTDIQNAWEIKTFGSGEKNKTYYLPYLKQNIKKSYSLSGKLLSTQTINTEVDNYANPTIVSKITKDSFGTYTTTTTSTFNNDETKWYLGELMRAQVNAAIEGVSASYNKKNNKAANSITRTSEFTYDPDTGMLVSTISNPDKPDFKVTKTVERDQFGNIIKTTMQAPNADDRITKNQYDTKGRYIISSTNPLNQTVTQEIDPKFGKPTTTTDLNGLKTTYTYNNFGQLLKKTNPDGTQDSIEYKWYNHYGINDPLTDPLYYAVYYKTEHVTDGDTKTTYYDMLNRQVATTHHGFNGGLIWQSTQYDNLGRVTQQSIPFKPSDEPLYDKFEYDVLGRVTKITKADQSVILNSYNDKDGISTTTTNQLNQIATEEKDARGNLAKTIDHAGNVTTYQYDSFGNLTQMTDSAGNISTITYDDLGHKLEINDPDKGHWTYKYDSLGELISQTDANGATKNQQANQTTSFKYDNLGRMIARTDAAGTSTWSYGNDPAKHNVNKLVQVNGVANISNVSSNKYGEIKINKPTRNQVIQANKENVESYSRTYEYDALSRPIKTTITLNGKSYTKEVAYDTDSRPQYIIYPNGEKVENIYDELGRLCIIDTISTPAYAYWLVYSMTPRMQIKSCSNEIGLVTTKTYDRATGRLENIQTKHDSSFALQNIMHGKILTKRKDNQKDKVSDDTIIQNLNYTYDALGQLKQRDDLANDIHETFTYDNLNRLTSWNYNGLPSKVKKAEQSDNDLLVKINKNNMKNKKPNIKNSKNIAAAGAVTYQYDALGNLTYKSDVGHYKYGINKNNPVVGPHAVTSIEDDSGKQIDSFTYDADGNQTNETLNGKSRTISYTSFGKPKEITTKDAKVDFYYNADRKRFMRVDQVGTATTTTLYLGDYQVVAYNSGTKLTTQTKCYIGPNALLVKSDDGKGLSSRTQSVDPGSRAVNEGKINNDGTKKIYYMLTDAIGSTTAITDETGNVIQRYHYSPFGQQIQFKGEATNNPLTHQGFTGHEEVEDVNLIHMNGRLYDPQLGRFLSADPTIQRPANSQSLNRYSYCINNPLTLTDPSGYSWLSNSFHHVDVEHLIQQIAQIAIAAIIMANDGFLAAAFASAVMSGMFALANGGNIGTAILSAGLAFTSAIIWNGVGTMLGEGGELGTTEAPLPIRVGVHGVVGGAMNAIEGGSFKDGFIACAAGEAASGGMDDLNISKQTMQGVLARSMTAGVVGGTAAAATGGNFINGASTAAFAELFNDCAHNSQVEAEKREWIEKHEYRYTDAGQLASDLGKNGIVFAERPLDGSGDLMFRDALTHALHIDMAHEEIFYTDSSGVLHAVGYFKGKGVFYSDPAKLDLSHYQFGPAYKNISTSYTTFHPSGFSAANYSTLTHNCQLYANTVRLSLHLRMDIWTI